MKNIYFRYKFRLLFLFIMIAAGSIAIRILMKYNFDKSALLYIGIPFLISLGLIWVRNPAENPSLKKRYLNRLIDAFIIMLGSSIVLFEGFVCVVMAMPIYLIVILILFLVDLGQERARKRGKSTLSMHLLPLLIVISAFEGVTPQMSFNRQEHVSVSRVVEASIAEIKHNLIQPMELQKARPWFLHIFPMPYHIKAGTLSPGDVHEIHFQYYRWFVTNMHEGRMLLKIAEVEENRIKTTFLEDTSYISNYLRLQGTEITLDKIDEQHTRVTLRIDFERLLDPHWYFSPVERFGVSKTAEFLIAEVIARDAN